MLKTSQKHNVEGFFNKFVFFKSKSGPPPPPLPPPLKAPNPNHHFHNIHNSQLNPTNEQQHNLSASSNNNSSMDDSSQSSFENLDSDSGLEVVEEPTLRPSELVRGNHNRTMSTISGKFNFQILIYNNLKTLCYF